MAAALPFVAIAATVAGVAANIQGSNAAMRGADTAIEGNNAAAAATQRAAQRRAVALEFEAEQLDQDAGLSIAAAQRVRDEEVRKAALVASRALAVAAASGASASDSTIVNLIARTQGEGAYRGAVALFEGEDRARRLRMGAAGKRYESAVTIEGGYDASSAYGYKNMAIAAGTEAAYANSMGNIAKGIGSAASMFTKYGGDGPPKPLFSGSGGSGDSSLIG